MRAALGLAERNLGRVWPNPSAGCLLVRDGRVIARGWTQPGGRPHAEIEALTRAGTDARGATVYVSLEPCCHFGRTPPCTDALLQAGVARVVYAVEDPDPRVSGRGAATLREAGIRVDGGLLAVEAHAVNEGFFRRLHDGRPMITLKLATSLDGRIAVQGGRSRWITGAEARASAHLMRARHDAVMIGIGTALADDPMLTCRLPGAEDRSPLRIVADGRLRLPLTAELVRTASDYPTWLLALEPLDGPRAEAFEAAGVRIIACPSDESGLLDLTAGLRLLGDAGLTRVLVEGGATLAAGLLRRDLVDRIAWFRAPSVIGGDGHPAAEAFGIADPAAAPRFRAERVLRLGADLLETLVRDG